MSEMIERVAQAIYASSPFPDGLEFLDPEPWRSCIDSARAAIAAMREPTESMRRKLWLYGNHPDKEFVMDGGMWREMIDAALECSTKPDGQ